MKLWLLRPIVNAGGAWRHAYGVLLAVVVRAPSEAEARRLAMLEDAESAVHHAGVAWLDPAVVTCEEITAEGAAGVIIAHTTE